MREDTPSRAAHSRIENLQDVGAKFLVLAEIEFSRSLHVRSSVSWGSKKQGSTAQHTAEAEVVSCLRSELLPAKYLLQKLLQRAVNARIMEDSSACITSVEKRYSPSMRHLPRTQKVSIGMLHEVVNNEATEKNGTVALCKAKSEEHLGDVMTKELEASKFEKAVEMLRISELGKNVGNEE